MNSDDNTARQNAWSAYWKSGRLHSCVDASGANYGGAIGAFWTQWATSLAAGARVLDLATGNGPLPRLLSGLPSDGVEIDAVDLAAIAPAWHDARKQPFIRFHAGVSMEALPFPPETFDAVVSQFGFEYANRSDALAECVRVCKQESRIALVMHHADSVFVKVGQEELRHHEQLASEGGLLRAAAEVIPWMTRIRQGAAPDAGAGRARERYNAAMSALTTTASRSPAPDLLLEARNRVHGLLAKIATGAPVLDELHAYIEALKAARLRTSEMVEAALKPADIEVLACQLAELRPGSLVDFAALRQEEGVIAWSLVARTPSGALPG